MNETATLELHQYGCKLVTERSKKKAPDTKILSHKGFVTDP